MKKLVMILFVLGFVSAAFAEEAKKDLPLKVGVSGIVYTTTYKGVVKDSEGDYSASRIRPLFNFTNGDIEAVFKLEVDSTWGAATGDTKASETTGIAADKKGVEVANAYIKTKIDGLDGLTLKGGLANYDFPLIFGENVPMANINFSNDMIDAGLYYVKTSENSNSTAKDDAQIYIADAKIKFGESSIRPAGFIYQIKKDAVLASYPAKDAKGYMGGLSANLVMGTFGIDASAAYGKGTKRDPIPANPTKKVTGYAFDIAPYIKIDPIKITPFFTMLSGDNGSSTTKSKSFNDVTIDGSSTGTNNFRLFILEDAGSFTSNSDVAGAARNYTSNGYMAYGLSVDATFGRLTAKLQGAYAQAAKVATGVKKDLGIEVDANVGFALTKSSTLYVEGAYLKTGKFYQSATVQKQNAQYVNLGVTYSI